MTNHTDATTANETGHQGNPGPESLSSSGIETVVDDGGADGDASTDDGTQFFLKQGVFVP